MLFTRIVTQYLQWENNIFSLNCEVLDTIFEVEEPNECVQLFDSGSEFDTSRLLTSPNPTWPSVWDCEEASLKFPLLLGLNLFNFIVSQHRGEDFEELKLSKIAPGALIISGSPLHEV